MIILFGMLFISGASGEDMVTTRVIIPRTHGKNSNSELFDGLLSSVFYVELQLNLKVNTVLYFL